MAESFIETGMVSVAGLGREVDQNESLSDALTFG